MTEFSLHSQIKNWYKQKEDRLEVKLENYIIDILRNDLLIEIQTRNFSSIRKKLEDLLITYQVRLVYPISKQKWIVHTSESGQFIRKRKSPRKGKLIDLFYQMVYLPSFIINKNFSIEVLLIEEEEFRSNDGKGSWRRRGASITDRKLLNVFERFIFKNSHDFLVFLPKNLEKYFTNKILALNLGISIKLAQKITYCLRKMGVISIVDKKGSQLIFQIS
jgi:hypothetical protein